MVTHVSGKGMLFGSRFRHNVNFCDAFLLYFFVGRSTTMIVWINSYQQNFVARLSGKLLYSPSREFRHVRQTARRNTAGSLLNSSQSASALNVSSGALFGNKPRPGDITLINLATRFSELKCKKNMLYLFSIQFMMLMSTEEEKLLPALRTGCIFSRVCNWLFVFPRYSL